MVNILRMYSILQVGPSGSDYYQLDMKVGSEDLAVLTRFSQGDNTGGASIQEAHRVLSDMIQTVRRVEDPSLEGLDLDQLWPDELMYWLSVALKVRPYEP